MRFFRFGFIAQVLFPTGKMFERPLFMFSMNGRNDYTIKPVSLSINSLVPTRSCCSSLRHLNHGAQIHVSSLKLEGLFLLVINGSVSLPWNTISVPGQRKSNMWIIKSVKPSQTHTIKKFKKNISQFAAVGATRQQHFIWHWQLLTRWETFPAQQVTRGDKAAPTLTDTLMCSAAVLINTCRDLNMKPPLCSSLCSLTWSYWFPAWWKKLRPSRQNLLLPLIRLTLWVSCAPYWPFINT